MLMWAFAQCHWGHPTLVDQNAFRNKVGVEQA